MSESTFTEISVKGKTTRVPSICIDGRTAIVMGRWIRTAMVVDEDMIQGDVVSHPASFVAQLRNVNKNLKADIFTFAQKIPETLPKHNLYFEWDNLAVISIATYRSWWGGLADAVKRAIKKSQKLGVVVKEVEFNDSFVEGIRSIYNETPVRQGKPFWHYGKDFDAVKKQNSTFPERSTYVGAYYNEELIGCVWLVHVGKAAHMIQIISKMRDYDKRPSNALIAKAVEICEQKGVEHLVYGNYIYNDPNSSLTEFKRRNGFEKVTVPRYYVPLTIKGQIAIRLGLHVGVMGILPQTVRTVLLRYRSVLFERVVGPLSTMLGKKNYVSR
jgi:hypothetical protein